MRVWYSLYDRLLHTDVLEKAFKKVKSSNGAPGIDGQSCKGFALNRPENIAELLGEPVNWDPVKQQVVGNIKATAMQGRPRRPGYELPVV